MPDESRQATMYGDDGADSEEHDFGTIQVSDATLDYLCPRVAKMTGEEEIRLGREMSQLAIMQIRQRLEAAKAVLDRAGQRAGSSDKAAARAFLSEFNPRGLEGEELIEHLHELMFDGQETGRNIVRRFTEKDRRGTSIIRRFVEAHAIQVLNEAKKYVGRSAMSLDDLRQEGNLGLLDAIPRYDYRRGLRFWTFAVWWVQKHIIGSIADKDRAIRLPRNIIAEIGSYEKAKAQLAIGLGRRPTADELVLNLEVSRGRLADILAWRRYAASLDVPANREEADGDTVISNVAAPTDEELDRRTLLLPSEREQIRKSFDRLKPIEAEVLRLRFGLDGLPDMTHPEIAEKYGWTKQRIQQIEKSALSKLRKRLGTAFNPAV